MKLCGKWNVADVGDVADLPVCSWVSQGNRVETRFESDVEPRASPSWLMTAQHLYSPARRLIVCPSHCSDLCASLSFPDERERDSTLCMSYPITDKCSSILSRFLGFVHLRHLWIGVSLPGSTENFLLEAGRCTVVQTKARFESEFKAICGTRTLIRPSFIVPTVLQIKTGWTWRLLSLRFCFNTSLRRRAQPKLLWWQKQLRLR